MIEKYEQIIRECGVIIDEIEAIAFEFELSKEEARYILKLYLMKELINKIK